MSEELLRQPRTFWQWLTNQPGTIYSPPLPAAPALPRAALDIIDAQLQRIHRELNSFTTLEGAETKGYLALVASLDKLHEELIRRSKDETVPARQG
jgi:hypothetical protein